MRLRRTVAGAALTTVTASLLTTLPLTAAQAISADLVISQVYGGGGNSGATYTHDFVELFNRGTVPVPLGELSIQYASSAGSFTGITELPDSASLPPGGYFLVQLAKGSGGSTPLPTPDAQDSTAMSAADGKVVLVRGDAAWAGAGEASRVVDLVGYGSANLFEGATAAPRLSNSTAALRNGDGATDTDDNGADFTAGTPTPRNSGYVPAPPPPAAPVLPIAHVQGAGATSPHVGERVTIEGVVVGDFQDRGQYGGYFVQSLAPDADAATSEAIRVFDHATPVGVGERVRVTGTVEEFASSDTIYSGSETQIGSGAAVERLGTAGLPAPVAIELPFAQPQDGVDALERYEGMRVTVPAGLVATDLYGLGRYGELSLTTGELLRIPTSAEENAANDVDRIMIDDGMSRQNLDDLPYTIDEGGETLPRAGDVLAEPVTGVLSFAFGFYRVEPPVGTTAGFTRVNERTAAPDAVGGDVRVASYNVLNYFTDYPTAANGRFPRGASNDGELARQEAKLVSAITALDADVVGLVEIANDDGDALRRFVAALNAAQPDEGDHYTAVEAPELNAPTIIGGTYGTDAIRTAIIYRASVVSPVGGPVSDPELLDPVDPAFPEEPLFDRPPAVQTFTEVGDEREFTVLVSHLKSKGSTNEQCGTPDPFAGNCDDLRERQAQGLADLVTRIGAEDALLLGDLNAYEGEAPIDVLTDAGYVSAAADLSTADRYSYSFDGEFGTLDYVLASSGLAAALTGVDIWHINSAEAPAYQYDDYNQDALYAPDAYASSDHDPVLVGLDLDVAPVADAGGPYDGRVGQDVVLDASGSSDRNGDELSYAWDLDGDGAFDDADTATATFAKGRPPGHHPVAVQVTDGEFTTVAVTEVICTAAHGEVPPGRR